MSNRQSMTNRQRVLMRAVQRLPFAAQRNIIEFYGVPRRPTAAQFARNDLRMRQNYMLDRINERSMSRRRAYRPSRRFSRRTRRRYN